MSDESKYRMLLKQAQEGTEHIKSFLLAISGEAASEAPEIKSLAKRTLENLQNIQDGLDQTWDLFKRARK